MNSMDWVYEWFFPVVWAAYLIYWQIAAAGAKANQRIESVASRVLRTIAFFIGILLLCWPRRLPVPFLYRHFLPRGEWTFWLGAAITVGGLLFAVWARVVLGANWSRSVTIKQGHELITAGPYALVRHPIYTGLLTAFAGTAIATTQMRGLLAFALIFFSLLYKLRLEEKWMRTAFGATYVEYSRHTAALIPWVL
jgi:protein-S-isoprenylcysteine O-methyltransferase Ste14